MSYQKLLPQMIGLTLVVLSIAGYSPVTQVQSHQPQPQLKPQSHPQIPPANAKSRSYGHPDHRVAYLWEDVTRSRWYYEDWTNKVELGDINSDGRVDIWLPTAAITTRRRTDLLSVRLSQPGAQARNLRRYARRCSVRRYRAGLLRCLTLTVMTSRISWWVQPVRPKVAFIWRRHRQLHRGYVYPSAAGFASIGDLELGDVDSDGRSRSSACLLGPKIGVWRWWTHEAVG